MSVSSRAEIYERISQHTSWTTVIALFFSLDNLSIRNLYLPKATTNSDKQLSLVTDPADAVVNITSKRTSPTVSPSVNRH